jgi:hypothetical protein
MITNLKARINRALVQGLSVNQFAAKMQAKKGAMRSMIFKMWFNLVKHFKQEKSQIVCSKDKVQGILNIIDNSNGLKYAHIDAIFKTWALESQVIDACLKYDFQLVIAGE